MTSTQKIKPDRDHSRSMKPKIKVGREFPKIIAALGRHFGDVLEVRDELNQKMYMFDLQQLQEFSKLLLEDCLLIVDAEGYELGAAQAAATKIRRRFDIRENNERLYGRKKVDWLTADEKEKDAELKERLRITAGIKAGGSAAGLRPKKFNQVKDEEIDKFFNKKGEALE